MKPTQPQFEESRYGWVVVAVSFVMFGLGFGILVNISVFLKPLTAEFGWTRGETAFAYTAASLAAGFGGVVMGWLTDRYTARPVVLFGAVIMGLSLLLLSNLGALWQLHLYHCLLGGLGFAAFATSLIVNVGHWFTRNKGLAIGIVSAGGALGQAVVVYFAGLLITAVGWRQTYTTLAVIYWAVLIPLAFLLRASPRQLQAAGPPGGASGNADEQRFAVAPQIAVAWISVAVIFCCICMATPIIHVVALASDRGFGAQSAAGVLSAIMIAGLFGRIIIGKIADHTGGLHAYMLASAAQTVLVFWFVQLHSLAGLYALAILFGLGFSGVMTCILVCIREMTPPERNGVSLGIMGLFGWAGMGLGGWQGGFFFDLTGAYTLPYAIAALAGVVNLIILESLRRYIKQRQLRLQPQIA